MKDKIREIIYKRFNVSFSKSGEDMQLNQLLKFKKKGVCVDIGCWDPVKASNSYYFHLRGWKCICIDPNPKMEELFTHKRESDIFVNSAVGLGNKTLTYFMLVDSLSSMNTLDYSFIQQNKLEDKVVASKEIQTVSLKSILEEHLQEGESIDFFDVDVEGFDLEVLQSNDWERFRPKVILIETEQSLASDLQSEITKFLNGQNYTLIAKSVIQGNLGNLFFIDQNI